VTAKLGQKSVMTGSDRAVPHHQGIHAITMSITMSL
jgi:hypothetical protein